MVKILSLTTPYETSKLIEIIASEEIPAGTSLHTTKDSQEASEELEKRYYDIVIVSSFYKGIMSLVTNSCERNIYTIILNGYTLSNLRETAEKAGAKIFSMTATEGIKNYILDIINKQKNSN
ncbi:MAG: hypothetical protein QXF25_03425 [Candidatus Pacearchaeota archaeon]